ncbi:MAG: PAS domain S-box protein [Acidobacteriaceae bacterium]|nr:PAS domain S-box protein [Acidobacteriaceae bacterium]
MRSRVPAPVHFQVEYLESQRFGIAGYEQSLCDMFRHTYGGEKFDLVIAAAYPALKFAVDYRPQLFPGVPIVFISVAPNRLEGQVLWPGVTGVTVIQDVSGTLSLAFRFHPDTKNVAIITGTSEFERYWQRVVHKQFDRYAGRVRLIDLAGLPTEQLLKEVSTLPPHTVVFFQLIPLEASQPVTGTYDILAMISQRFPIYCILNYCLDHGAVGGSYTWPDDEQGIKGGELAARILAGEKPENIPVVHTSGTRPQVDWRQLRKWNIPESTLPPGTIVLYRQPTVWQRYRNLILLCIFLIVFQALLIIGLLLQRARKRKLEATLRESEGRFKSMADTAPSLIWMCDEDGKVTYQSEKRVAFTGGAPDSGHGKGWTASIHPADVKNVLNTTARALQRREGFSNEYRLRRSDGVYRWMLDVASTRFDANGSFSGFIGSAIDVTDQKLAQDALEKVSGRLIEAQERERSRIARELHDDICQRLALLSLELEQADESANGSGARRDAQIEDIRKHCAEIATDVQALSHELHSSKLDYLGVVAAIRGFCKEFSKQKSVHVQFTDENVTNHLPRDISLCLFRVTQEALHNSVKYSGASQYAVRLCDTADGIQLEVRDSGVGFDVEEAMKNGGLGLVSMNERIHLVNGTLSIESKLNEGTRIVACVPRPTVTAAAAGTV